MNRNRLLAASWAMTVGTAPAAVQPIIVQSLRMGDGLSATEAGLVATTELSALAACAMVASIRAGLRPEARLSRSWPWAVLGLQLAALLTLLMGSGVPALLASRSLAGLAYGLALAAGVTQLAKAHQPGRAFAWATLVSGVATGVWAALADVGAAQGGTLAGYAVGFVACLPLLFFGAAGQPEPTRRSETVASTSIETGIAPAVPLVAGGSVLIGNFAWYFAQGIYWPYAEQALIAGGVASDAAGGVLAAALVLGLAGALVSVLTAQPHHSRQTHLALASIVAMSAAAVGTITWRTPVAGITGVVAYNFMYCLALPGVMRIAAERDPAGRLAGVASGLALMGMAAGPWVGGALIDSTAGLAGVGVATLALSVFASGLLALAQRHPAPTSASAWAPRI